MNIRPMTENDADAVLQIFQEGCDTGNATFSEHAGTWTDWDAGHLPVCRLVAESGNVFSGWAALSPTSTRHVYRGVAEVGLYVAANARGQGVGAALLQEMIDAADIEGIWTLQALIFPENIGSMTLFQKFGFTHAMTRERLGLMQHGPMAGKWRDVAHLERRSEKAGI